MCLVSVDVEADQKENFAIAGKRLFRMKLN